MTISPVSSGIIQIEGRGGKCDWRKQSWQRSHEDGFSRTVEVSFVWSENQASQQDIRFY